MKLTKYQRHMLVDCILKMKLDLIETLNDIKRDEIILKYAPQLIDSVETEIREYEELENIINTKL